MNRYIYARDNPLMFVDPSGHMFILPTLNSYSPMPPQVFSTTTTTTTTTQVDGYYRSRQIDASNSVPSSCGKSLPSGNRVQDGFFWIVVGLASIAAGVAVTSAASAFAPPLGPVVALTAGYELISFGSLETGVGVGLIVAGWQGSCTSG